LSHSPNIAFGLRDNAQGDLADAPLLAVPVTIATRSGVQHERIRHHAH